MRHVTVVTDPVVHQLPQPLTHSLPLPFHMLPSGRLLRPRGFFERVDLGGVDLGRSAVG